MLVSCNGGSDSKCYECNTLSQGWCYDPPVPRNQENKTVECEEEKCYKFTSDRNVTSYSKEVSDVKNRKLRKFYILLVENYD